MKNNLHITTHFDKPEFLKAMVEKLVSKYTYGSKKTQTALMEGWEEMETSSTEAFVTGDINFEDIGIKLPFTTSYFFSCTFKDNIYRLRWATSLS